MEGQQQKSGKQAQPAEEWDGVSEPWSLRRVCGQVQAATTHSLPDNRMTEDVACAHLGSLVLAQRTEDRGHLSVANSYSYVLIPSAAERICSTRSIGISGHMHRMVAWSITVRRCPPCHDDRPFHQVKWNPEPS